MLLDFITVTAAWLAFILVLSCLLVILLKTGSDKPLKSIAGGVLFTVAMILSAIGALVRTVISVSLPLEFLSLALLTLVIVLGIRNRSG